MRHQRKPIQSDEEAAVTITIPAHALEAIEPTLSSQHSSGHNGLESNSPMIAGMATRGETFPCFKKSAWSDEVIVKIIPAHPAPGMA